MNASVRRVCLLLILITARVHAWRWPIDGPFQLEGTPDFAFYFSVSDPERFRIVAPGEGIFAQTPFDGERTTAIPWGEAYEVYRHENEIWSIVRWSEDRTVVEYRLYDARIDRFVNPRVLLPLEHEGPLEVLPTLVYRQDGVVREIEELRPGEVDIVALPSDWNSATIPLEITVLQAGRVIASHRFVHAEDIAARIEPDGSLRIASVELRVGVNRIEVQTRRYDGTTRLRTFDPRVSDGP